MEQYTPPERDLGEKLHTEIVNPIRPHVKYPSRVLIPIDVCSEMRRISNRLFMDAMSMAAPTARTTHWKTMFNTYGYGKTKSLCWGKG